VRERRGMVRDEDMEGQSFLAAEAVRLGLVDSIATLGEIRVAIVNRTGDQVRYVAVLFVFEDGKLARPQFVGVDAEVLLLAGLPDDLIILSKNFN
jgi:hypothetical protein